MSAAVAADHGGTPPSAAVQAAVSGDRPYVVQRGDTLWSLARRFGVDRQRLAAANGIADLDRITAGARLVIPPADPSASAPPATPPTSVPPSTVPTVTAPPAGGGTTVVQPGEGLWRISRRVGVPLPELLRANGLQETDRIVPGQVLVVPAPPPPTTVSPTTVPAPPPPTTVPAAPPPATTVPAAPPPATTPPATTVPPTAPGQAARPGPSDPARLARLPFPLATSTARLAWWPALEAAATESGLPFDLLAAMCWHESTWLAGARSPAGAIGVCQVMPGTGAFVARDLLRQPDLRLDDGTANIRIGARYLRYLLDRFGDEQRALAAYFQGPTAVQRNGISEGGRRYVASVQALRWRFS